MVGKNRRRRQQRQEIAKVKNQQRQTVATLQERQSAAKERLLQRIAEWFSLIENPEVWHQTEQRSLVRQGKEYKKPASFSQRKPPIKQAKRYVSIMERNGKRCYIVRNVTLELGNRLGLADKGFSWCGVWYSFEKPNL